MRVLIQGLLLWACCLSAVQVRAESVSPGREAEVDAAWLGELERSLAKAYRMPATDRLELTAPKPPGEPGLLSGPGRLEIVAASLPPLGPRLVFRCQRREGDRVTAEGVVRLEAKVWRKVWVPSVAVPRGEVLGSGAVEELRDVCGLGGATFQGALDDGNWIASEPLRPGGIILARQVAAAPIVRRGQALEGILNRGSMSIKLGVTALEVGARGQMIRVRNSASLKELKGKVVDEKTVQIQL